MHTSGTGKRCKVLEKRGADTRWGLPIIGKPYEEPRDTFWPIGQKVHKKNPAIPFSRILNNGRAVINDGVLSIVDKTPEEPHNTQQAIAEFAKNMQNGQMSEMHISHNFKPELTSLAYPFCQ